MCTVKTQAKRINPMNAVQALETLGCELELAELGDLRLDSVNRPDVDRIRQAIKNSFTPDSLRGEATKFWNSLMTKGPDSMAGGDTPQQGQL